MPPEDPQPAAPAPAPREKDLFGREPEGYPDWSHRRAEPRVFALIWMLFLMAASASMFASMSGALSVSETITRPAARAMLVVVAAGIALLWPAIRLSQVPSSSPTISALRDWFVVIVPTQAVIWPQALRVLGWWPLSVLLAIAGLFAAWGLVSAGLIALATSGPRGSKHRVAWTLIILVAAFGAPTSGMLLGITGPPASELPRVGWMLSPITSVIELTRDRTPVGPAAPLDPDYWRMIIATACIGIALLLIARATELASRKARP